MSRDWTPRDHHLADIAIHNKSEREGKNEWMHDVKLSFFDNTPEAKKEVEGLASKIDEILYTHDYYGYQDALTKTREDNIADIAKDIAGCKTDHILKELKEIRKEYEDSYAVSDVAFCAGIDDVVKKLDDYTDKHKLWNDEARREFPHLSFLMNGFETEIYPSLTPDEKEFYTMVEKFIDLEAEISTMTFAYHTDKVMTLVDDKNYLKGLSDENNLTSDAVFRWYNGLMSEISDLNARLFKNELEEIYSKREKDIDL